MVAVKLGERLQDEMEYASRTVDIYRHHCSIHQPKTIQVGQPQLQ